MNIVIPNLGDIEEVEVIEICVAPGDVVEVDDALLVIESDKASMEIPSSAAGVVKSLEVAVGDMVTEGHVIAVVEGATDSDQPQAPETAEQISEPPADAQPVPELPEALAPTQGAEAHDVDVLVPDIGDAGEVVVIEVAVKPGDAIAVDDLLVVLESDKASMEIAAEHAGTVLAVLVEEGHTVEKGSHIATLKVEGGATEAAPVAPAAEPEAVSTPQTLVPETDAPQKSAPTPAVAAPSAESTEPQINAGAKVYAGPAVRRLARELGVDLGQVQGTGNRNRIVKDDVKQFVKILMQTGATATGGGGSWPSVAQVDFAKFGPVEMMPLTRIQQRGADNLHRSWVNLPHVTQHDEADITDLEAFRASLKKEAEQRGVKVTPLAFIVKACCQALREHPNFNASLHEDHKQLVVKGYINIGMAVDTPDGLVVPVIKNADQKSVWELSADIALLSEKARDKKLGMDDMQGGTFSVSSLGAIGGTGFTPIVNAPEVAILGVAKLQTKPIWDGATFVPRKVLPLSLSYDHRVINGADGGRFMTYLAGLLSDIRRLAL